MKLRLLVVALLAALGSGCASIDKPRQAMDVEPLFSVRHGAPDAQSHYQLGRYYQGQYRLAQAEAAYLKAIAIDRRNLDAYNALGRLYAERGELERATKMFEQATALSPKTAYLYNNLGFAYYLRGRFDEAYVAVRKALILDASLARGWVNLEKIVASRPDSTLLAAVKARRVDALPSDFSAAVVILAGDPPATVALASDPQNIAQITTVSSESLSPGAAAVRPGADKATEELIAGSKYVLVSASREAVANEGVILITSAATGSPNPGPQRSSRPATRLEVSNANGVSRFATRFSAKLRSDDIPVARITNFGSSQLQQTVIEYQPGYEDEARELIGRARIAVRLIPAIKPRPRSDIRIVLGLDALNFVSQARADAGLSLTKG